MSFSLGEFVVKLGFSADTLKIKDFVSAIKEMPIEAAAAITALAGIDYELIKIAENAMNTAAGFQMFTSQTGLSWQELQKWELVAQQANVSTDAVASSINTLQRNLAEIRMGRGNIAPFQLLGINLQGQDAFGVLQQLRRSIRGVDRATATNLISQMGLNPEMIQMLTLTDRQFEHLSKTVSGMTGGQQASFLRLKLELNQFGMTVRELGFTYLDHLVGGFEGLVAALRNLHLWMPGIIAAAAALAIAFAPMTAGVIALMLVLDDLAVYFQGGDSLIGRAIKGIAQLAKELENIHLPGMQTLDRIMALMKGAGLMLPGILPMVAQTGMAQAAVTQNNTINVHSTAPAHEVGKAVKHEIDKGVSKASLQTNNQGY